MHEPKTKTQIAEAMGISLRTLQRWIKKHGLDVPRGLVAPDRQEEIYQTFGFKKGKSQDGTNSHVFDKKH